MGRISSINQVGSSLMGPVFQIRRNHMLDIANVTILQAELGYRISLGKLSRSTSNLSDRANNITTRKAVQLTVLD